MSGGTAGDVAGDLVSDLDQQGYIEELKRTLVIHRTAVRGVLEQVTTKLEGLQRDHIDQQERLLRRLNGVNSNAPGSCRESEAQTLRKESSQASMASIVEQSPARNYLPMVPPTPRSAGVAPLSHRVDAAKRNSTGSGKSISSGIAWDGPQPGDVNGEGPRQQRGAKEADGESPPSSVAISRSLGTGRPLRNLDVGPRTTTGQWSQQSSRWRIQARTSGFSMLSDYLSSVDGDSRGAMWSCLRQVVDAARMLIEHSRKDKPMSFTERVVKGWIFKAITTAAILLNAMCIGIHTNHSLALALDFEKDEDAARAWVWVECVFTIFFAGELVLRAVAESTGFLFGKNWKWNFFDTVLVATSVVGLLVEAVQSSSNRPPDFSFARMLRLIRFTRVLRLLRAVRFSESLRLMIFAIMASIWSLFWIWIVLFFVIYFWAVFFLSGVIDHYTDDSMASFVAVDSMRVHFGSVLEAILALFMCITGGRDWFDVVLPLWEISPWYTLAFSVYIFFMTLGVLNVVVGSFVDNAQQVSRNDREMVVRNEIKQEREYMARVRDVFSEADKDGDGSLSWEEFEDYLQDDRVAAYLGSLGLDSSIARTLFVLLDVDDTNSVGIDEFVGGCLRLKGQARSIDVNMLLYNSEKMICKTSESMEAIGHRLDGLASHLGLVTPLGTPRSTDRPGSRPRPIALQSKVLDEQDLATPKNGARPQSGHSSHRSGAPIFSHRDASADCRPSSSKGEIEIYEVQRRSFDRLLPTD